MPQISYFFGISIFFCYNDHAPPHFHAEYAGERSDIRDRDPGMPLG